MAVGPKIGWNPGKCKHGPRSAVPCWFNFSPAEWMAQKSPNYTLSTRMVFPKSLKFMNSGSEILTHTRIGKREASLTSVQCAAPNSRTAEQPNTKARSTARNAWCHWRGNEDQQQLHLKCSIWLRPLEKNKIKNITIIIIKTHYFQW